MYDGLLPIWASKKVVSVKYFTTLWTKESGFFKIRLPCFANNAKLKAFKSLKPIPPSIFGEQSFSHDTQASFLSFAF